jgi:hypothetical protein
MQISSGFLTEQKKWVFDRTEEVHGAGKPVLMM